ncbi:MAG: hypothetical protein KGM42_20880 [Hyphomicrobiales bacterium]|nr:hypothetical protein [Hyphomicrobiales bacterium]
MLVAINNADDRRVEAGHAVKGPAYSCPGCKAPVALAKGRIRRAYFGHRPGAACSYAALETWEHQQAKEDFATAYRARGLMCDVEIAVLSIDGDRRADVLLHAPDDAYRVALEVQNSPLDYTALEVRTTAYLAASVPVIWVPILIRKRLGDVQRIAGTNIYHVSHFSAPPWQLWVQDLQGGLWYYDPVARCIWRGLLDDCMLYRNPTSWFADGDEHSAGGHWYSSERWSSLFLEGPFDLSHLRVRRVKRALRKRRTYHLPAGIGADFILADEPRDYAMPARIGRTKADGPGDFHYYRAEHRIDDQWVGASLEASVLPDIPRTFE